MGLNFYDYGARNYDPEIGRWINLDVLSEEFAEYSPYVYTYNDPVRHIDPDGNAPEDRLGEIDPPAKKKSGVSAETINSLNRPLASAGGYPGQGLDEIVTAGLQWLGGKVSGSDVSKETSENFQFATSLAIVIVSKGKNTKADGEVVEGLTKVETNATKTSENISSAHGNSKSSTKAQHNYDIQDTYKGDKVVKNGTSSGKETKSGQSYRGNSQANKWNKTEGTPGRYKSNITNRVPTGKEARQKALDYEVNRSNQVRSQLDATKHKRP